MAAPVAEDCSTCVGTPGVGTAINIHPLVQTAGLQVVKVNDGTCNVSCEQTAPCKFEGHYQIGSPNPNGVGPFHDDQIPQTNSVLIAGFDAIQSKVTWTAACGDLTSGKVVSFTTVGPPARPIGDMTFNAACAACQ